MLQPGTFVDNRYEIIKQLGEGGLATAYHAIDRVLKKDVVLKLLKPDASLGAERLRHEAQVLRKLNHPNIAPFLAFEVGSRWTYLVVEMIPGEHLGKVMRARTRPFDVKEITPWIGSLCDTLSYLESKDIVHRDIKPDNIIIAPDKRLVLIDFNVAMDLAQAATDPYARNPVGAAVYTAPEQMSKRAVDQRADIYALGVIIFEMLAGVRPFDIPTQGLPAAEKWERYKRVKTTRDPPSLAEFRPDLPAEIVAIVNRALAQDPEQRWLHAANLWAVWLQALGAPPSVLANVKTSATPGLAAGRRRNNNLIVIIIALVLTLGLAGGVMVVKSGMLSKAVLAPSTQSARYAINACESVSYQESIGQVTWQSCVQGVDLTEDKITLHIRWLPTFPSQLAVQKPSDADNPNTYLLDAEGNRYDHIQVSGDAGRDVQLVSGHYYTGAYVFPRPSKLNDVLTFVEEDVSLRNPFTLPGF